MARIHKVHVEPRGKETVGLDVSRHNLTDPDPVMSSAQTRIFDFTHPHSSSLQHVKAALQQFSRRPPVPNAPVYPCTGGSPGSVGGALYTGPTPG